MRVATERLGWPDRRGWRALGHVLVEVQRRRVYDIDPDVPTATCHLQESDEVPALCGYEWEGLVPVPGDPAWTDLHPDLRCDECSAMAGVDEEDPPGRTYRFRGDR